MKRQYHRLRTVWWMLPLLLGMLQTGGRAAPIAGGGSGLTLNHFAFVSNTGANATLGIPASIVPSILGTPLEPGDEIAVFADGISTPDSFCVGAVVWMGENTAITVWLDNDQTSFLDGARAGTPFRFRLWRQSTDKEYGNIAVAYSQGSGTFSANGISTLSSLAKLPHYAFRSSTGNNATVGILSSSNPNIFSVPLSPDDEIAVFADGISTPDSFCVGGVVWNGPSAAITVWGDDEQTPSIDGIRVGTAMRFHLWQYSTGKEYKNISVSYSQGSGFYVVNGIYTVAGMGTPQHFSFRTTTGNNATVGIPISCNSNILGSPLEPGDEIAVFADGIVTPDSFCVGATYWLGQSTAITVWGDDDQTPALDGIRVGTTMKYRIWRHARGIEFRGISAAYVEGSGVYAVNGISKLSSLAKTSHFNFNSTTGNNASVGLPVSINPTVAGIPLTDGDEIGVFADGFTVADSFCVGSAAWNGQNLAITVWGDNDQTPGLDGIRAGTPLRYRIWRLAPAVEYRGVNAVYSQGDGIYAVNGIYMLSSLNWLSTPRALASPKSVSFGKVPLGRFKDTTVTVTNVGNDTLKISAVTSSSGVFSSRPVSRNLLPGQFFVDTIRFTPAVIGAISANLFILSNSSRSPDTILVSGTGDTPNEAENSENMPKEFSLSQNYPNPFNPSTVLHFTLPVRSYVRLTVFNLLGQTVDELVEGEREAGEHSLRWGQDATTGMYLYRIEAVCIADPSKRFTQVRKMLLLK
ncbi:MAG: DUF1573 domain-containing protein [Bacteroidota bacterium]